MKRQLFFMKGNLRFLLVLAALCPLGLGAQGIADVVSALERVQCYKNRVTFAVSMPQLSEDVVYDVALTSRRTPDDPLMTCEYLIDWTLRGRDGAADVKGFSAYYDGHHYRYSGERLQEYHMEWDSVPFMPRGMSGLRGDGVQRSAQFVNLLPNVLGQDLEKYLSDSIYRVKYIPDTLIGGKRREAVKVDMIIGGMTAMEAEYVFDPATHLPQHTHFENSPGTVSEQTVDITYSPDATVSDDCVPLSEKYLMDIYPSVFESFRQSNFRIENLPGTRLPGFSIPTTTGERYSRRTSDTFRAPTIVALLEADGGFNQALVADLRQAVDRLPFQADVIWAFTDNNIDRIESAMPSIRPGEHLLMSARGLARDCGTAALPVLIIANADGVVTDVVLGYNKDLTNVVIQKMAFLK